MRYLKRHRQIIGIIGFLFLILCGCAETEVAETDTPITLQIENKDGSKMAIKSWTDNDGKQHMFLPSYCNMSDIVSDVKQKKDMNNIQFLQSENVATLFINTESGSMESIHNDKGYRESAEAFLYTAEGELNYSTSECSIKGRGNTTWELFEKKPYQLKLDTAADLLGMGAGKKWILLANAFDETNLRNKFVYDLARENDFCYAPECEFVDLYLNGEYRGVYLLTERVEFGEERLNVETDEKYMCNLELAARWDALDNAFLTDSGRAVEIREPDEPTEQDFERIAQIVRQMENAILYPKAEVSLGDIIDIDSWAYKYLIDEITENGDADIASSYFYYVDGKIYAGPLWDYDNTLGVSTRNQNPCTFLARSGYTYINHGTPYYDALYEQEEFYDRMIELYRTEVVPSIQMKLEHDIFKEEAQIAKASTMNRIRWADAFDEQNAEITDVQGIADYLEKRITFLDTAWIGGTEYYTVQFEPYVLDMYATSETSAGSYAVKPDEYFTENAVIERAEEKNAIWIDYETGEIFDSTQAITKNKTLILQWK